MLGGSRSESGCQLRPWPRFEIRLEPPAWSTDHRLGRHDVIKGWEEGIADVRVGGKRTLIIPSALAYRKRGLGYIVLPNQNLIFDVELVELKGR